MKKVYQVLVYGSVFFESENELIADEYCRLTKTNWPTAIVKPKRVKK